MKYLPYVMIVLLVMVVGCRDCPECPECPEQEVNIIYTIDGFVDTTITRPDDTTKVIKYDYYKTYFDQDSVVTHYVMMKMEDTCTVVNGYGRVLYDYRHDKYGGYYLPVLGYTAYNIIDSTTYDTICYTQVECGGE